ncbi:hypothetical protein BC941DRAFT_471834 [Chlamydoabsidia padenii]|nr:hypothetical protein BC941DRAFT_471834 [Chlamydoabsidia padenii]
MAHYIEFYSNTATTPFDYHHPLDICLFEKKLDFHYSSYLLMDPPKKRQGHDMSPSPQTKRPKRCLPDDITLLQNTLDYLQDEWATIDIVLTSLRNAFTVYPEKLSSEEYLDEIDREQSIAYDDLMAQVRSLDRSLKRLDIKIKSCHTAGPLV